MKIFWVTRDKRGSLDTESIFLWSSKPTLEDNKEWHYDFNGDKEDYCLLSELTVKDFKKTFGFMPELNSCEQYKLVKISEKNKKS